MNTEEQHKEIDLLIIQYLSGKPERETIKRLKAWSEESEANRKYVRTQLELWFSSGVSGSKVSFEGDKAFDSFKRKITFTGEQKKTVHRFYWKVLYRVAAVVLILLLPLTYWRGKEAVKQTFANMVVEAPMGANTKLYLPDGTLVWLNAGSKIVYSQGFGVDDRTLSLEGEGYFEVSRNEDIPFVIDTKEVKLQVLGTKFNFKNYPDEEEVTVNLMEGKVALHNELKAMPELYLEPDEKMVLNKYTGEMSKSKTNTASMQKSWTNNELYFDEEPLKNIAKELMRCYNVRIQVADSLKNEHFYGDFKYTENTIEEVLRTMSSTGRLKYKLVDKQYILY